MKSENVGAESARVKSFDGVAGVFAARTHVRGERLLPLRGRTSAHQSRYSIQITVDRHIEPDSSVAGETPAPWKFLNHSCDPNLEINLEAECFVARREIAEGEELTFNYLTTEWEMASPFDCTCGHPSCFGRIRGFRSLSTDEQTCLLPVAAAHIRLHREREMEAGARSGRRANESIDAV